MTQSSDNLIFGLHAVQSLLRNNPGSVRKLCILQGRHDARLQKALSLSGGLEREYCTRAELDERCNKGKHQGIAAYVSGTTKTSVRHEAELEPLLKAIDGPAFLLVLDGVTDPHNLGACLRTAEAAGVHAVITTRDKAVGITPVVSKVACGAAEVMPFFQVTNLARSLRQLQAMGIWIMGTAGSAEQSIHQAKLAGPLAIVMGAEGKGMRRLTRECCDDLVRIPMAGQVSSLNVSVASGITLFEVIRQRTKS